MHPVDLFIKIHNGKLPTENDPEYLELLRMGKFRILDVPDGQPGKCANCGASRNDGRKYVDLGNYIEWYGTLTLCGYCIKELATALGLIKPLEEKIEVLLEENSRLTDLKESGINLQEKLLHGFEEVKDYYARVYSSGNDSSTNSGSLLRPHEESYTTELPKTVRSSRASNTRASKPTTSPGRENIRSLAELLESDS